MSTCHGDVETHKKLRSLCTHGNSFPLYAALFSPRSTLNFGKTISESSEWLWLIELQNSGRGVGMRKHQDTVCFPGVIKWLENTQDGPSQEEESP